MNFIYNLPNVTNLNLTLDIVIKIYTGEITVWNDDQLKRINPEINLPNAKILVTVSQCDGTADTYLVTSMLSDLSPEFRRKYGTVYSAWPTDANLNLVEQCDVLLMAVVNTTTYSIGYATSGNIMLFSEWWKLTSAKILISEKEVAEYTLINVLSSVKRLFEDQGGLLANKITNDPTTVSKNINHPFLYFHYLAVNRTTVLGSCCSMQETTGFINYFLEMASKKSSMLTKYGYSPLPDIVSEYVRQNLVPLITCNSTVLIKEYQAYIPLPFFDVWKVPIIVGLSLFLGMVLLVFAFGLYYKRTKRIRETFWLIDKEEISLHYGKGIQTNAGGTSVHSVVSEVAAAISGSVTGRMVDAGYFNNKIAHWKRNDTTVVLQSTTLKHLTNWNSKTKLLIGDFTKSFTHPNICPLYGIVILDKHPNLVHQHCIKGTLNYVLTTCPYHLSADVKFKLAEDVLLGLKYLHQKGIVHGKLNSLTCQVDGMWNVKVAEWALYSISSNLSSQWFSWNVNDLDNDETLIIYLYTDPNTVPPNKPTFSGDIYSYGMLLVQIFTRKLPYAEEVELSANNYHQIIGDTLKHVQLVPEMNPNDVPSGIQMLVRKLIGSEVFRPDLPKIVSQIHKMRERSNKSIVDIMMQTIENYVEELEDKVAERTSELMDMTQQMKELLYELLPPQIAEKFIKRQYVEPEFYDCVTIFFSDIVGFTTISAKSSPLQVMSFLNELWQLFDKTIEQYDVYKVDTIGDAYMVASGYTILFIFS